MLSTGPGPRLIDLGDPVAWDHPLNRGLLSWWLPLPNNAGGTRLFDLTGRAAGTVGSGTVWAPGPNGFAALRTSGGSDVQIVVPATANPWYLSYWVYVDSFPGGFSVLLDDAGRAYSAFYDGAGNPSFNMSYGVITLGKWTHLVHKVDTPSTITTWRDGVSVTSNGGGGTSTGTTISFGANPSGGGSTTNARYSDIRFGAGDIDVPALYAQGRLGHPDALRRYTPAVRSFGKTAAGGGAAYTLTADSGSFSLAGTAASLEVGRRLDAAPGSFALTGTAASLEVGRVLSAASGSFALSGAAAGLLATRLLAGGSGSFALIGTAASLEVGRVLSAGSGAFTLSGQSATLVYSGASPILDAETGAFTLTGAAVAFALARKLTAAGGAFTLTGQAATLTYSGVVTEPGRVVCLAGADRSATTFSGADRSVTTFTASGDC